MSLLPSLQNGIFANPNPVDCNENVKLPVSNVDLFKINYQRTTNLCLIILEVRPLSQTAV